MTKCMPGLLLLLVGAVALLASEPQTREGILRQFDPERGALSLITATGSISARLDPKATVTDKDGKTLADGLRSPLLHGAKVEIDASVSEGNFIVQSIRYLAAAPANPRMPPGRSYALPPLNSIGLKPLTDLSADDRYHDRDGGLYGGGMNEPSKPHADAAMQESARIVPRAADGQPSAEGKIVLISISMSNATQLFTTFKQKADADPQKSSSLMIVDCAQNREAMEQWAPPNARPWKEAERRLAAAGVSARQVQAAWIKLANVLPTGDFNLHTRKLRDDTLAVLQNVKAKFPNVRIVYLSSRTYAGYSNGILNPEPYAYESAFAVRDLITDQIAGKPELAYRGEATKVPLLLWGPYLWSDGVTPRKSDGLVWNREDFGADGTHPSDAGRMKGAGVMLGFFKTDPFAQPWFVAADKTRSAPKEEEPQPAPRLKPINEMTENDSYQMEVGGLYGAGQNDPPKVLVDAAKRESDQIVPRMGDGAPGTNGKIAVIAMSMSNAEQEFGAFQKLVLADDEVSPNVVVVNTAQGGRAMSAWATPRYRTFEIAEERLKQAGVTPRQVQVAWIKIPIELVQGRPVGSKDPQDLRENMKKVRADTKSVLNEAKSRYPNLRIAFLGSRTYGGYCSTDLNPEPYAYQSGFAARALILDQLKGDKSLNFDPARGAVMSPLLFWGPYLWADGLTPRSSDALQWERNDFGRDGIHPSARGEQKVAKMLLKFFKTEDSTKRWFLSTHK